MEDILSLPTAETGLCEKSKLCMDIKYNTAIPDFSENIFSPQEEAKSENKSELCITTKLYIIVPYSIVTGTKMTHDTSSK